MRRRNTCRPLVDHSQPTYRHDRYSDKTKAPVVDAYVMPDGHRGVWCEYCDYWHLHGEGEGTGHRCAPCRGAGGYSNSPYYETGYILRPAGPAPKELLDLTKRRARARAAAQRRYEKRYQIFQ